MRGRHQWVRALVELMMIVTFGVLIAISLDRGSQTANPEEEMDMQEHVSTHVDASGDSHVTRTVRITSPLESIAAWTQRHKDAFDAIKAAYP